MSAAAKPNNAPATDTRSREATACHTRSRLACHERSRHACHKRSRVASHERSRVEPLESRVLFAAGDLDMSFNGVGKVTLDYFSRNDFGNAVAVQSDNKVLVAGTASTGTTTGTDVTVARYNVDGSLDSTFGVGGRVVTHLGGTGDSAFALAVQSDGRVVLAGGARAGATATDFALVRYNADGTLDGSFGTDGIVRTDFSAGANDLATAMTILADGRIVLAGWTTVVGEQHFAAARYTSSGALDTSFGGDGTVVAQHTNGTGQAKALAALADGSIILAGMLLDYDATGRDYAAIRLLDDGSLDTSFGSAGWATVDLGGGGESANSVVVTSDGGIILAGESSSSTQQVVGVARLTSDGQLDNAFGAGAGYVLTNFAGGINWGSAAHLQSDGQLIVAGTATVNGLARFAAVRYNTDGSLDAAFGAGGTVTHGFAAGESFAKALAVDSQGRLVIAGNVAAGSGNFDIGVVRLENTPPNAAPIAHAGGAYTVDAGSSIVLDGSGSSDADGSIVAYEWDFNYDGSAFDVDATGAAPTFAAPADAAGAPRTIALRCIDDDGAASVITTTITITLPPPPQGPGTAVLVADPDAPGKQMLSVQGTAGSDRIRFKAGKQGAIEVRLDNRKLGTFSGMTRIIIDAGAGNDVIDARKVNVPVVLVGGTDSDLLVGGKANNILIGFEDDVASMSAVLAEWSRPDRSLSQRIANLMNGGGNNGSVALAGNVEEDKARDSLFGSTGADWLLSGAGDRVVRIR